MTKVLFVAGHNNIEAITQQGLSIALDRAATVEKLKRSTGSRGEREWTGTLVQLAADALRAVGVDASYTDAIFHQDVYAEDYALIHICHFHRDDDSERAMFATIDPILVPAEMSAAARAQAQRFVDRLVGGYTAATGIPVTEPLVTLNMTQIYNYGYVTADSPAYVAEFGNANLDSAVMYELGISRIVKFLRDCTLEHLNLPAVVTAPPSRRVSDIPPAALPPTPSLSPTKSAAVQLRSIADTLDKL